MPACPPHIGGVRLQPDLVSVVLGAYDDLLMKKLSFVAVALCLLAGPAGAQTTASGDLGTIQFPTSPAGPAQSAFLTGVESLHNFQFDTASDAFRPTPHAAPGLTHTYSCEAL